MLTGGMHNNFSLIQHLNDHSLLCLTPADISHPQHATVFILTVLFRISLILKVLFRICLISKAVFRICLIFDNFIQNQPHFEKFYSESTSF